MGRVIALLLIIGGLLMEAVDVNKKIPQIDPYTRIHKALVPNASDGQFEVLSALLKDSLALQETNQQNITQSGGGPGRGYYQYEQTLEGINASKYSINASGEQAKMLAEQDRGFGISSEAVKEALIRAKRAGIQLPKDFNETNGNLMELPKELQEAIFLADKAYTKGSTASANKILKSKTQQEALDNLADFWAKHHKKINVEPKELNRFKARIKSNTYLLDNIDILISGNKDK